MADFNIYKMFAYSTHLLIAGTTGAGKSNVLTGILNTFPGRDVKGVEAPAVVLIDPKRVELKAYSKTLHCLAYTTESADAAAVLDAVNVEIERRYKKVARRHGKIWSGQQLYVIIDELADLLLSKEKKQIMTALQKMLQLGRAAGVHVIACTQAPGRRVLPAEIVLNFTDRLALRCISAVESRQIINVKGAEALPRYGRGIYLNPDGLYYVSLPLATPPEDPRTARRLEKAKRKASKRSKQSTALVKLN